MTCRLSTPTSLYRHSLYKKHVIMIAEPHTWGHSCFFASQCCDGYLQLVWSQGHRRGWNCVAKYLCHSASAHLQHLCISFQGSTFSQHCLWSRETFPCYVLSDWSLLWKPINEGLSPPTVSWQLKRCSWRAPQWNENATCSHEGRYIGGANWSHEVTCVKRCVSRAISLPQKCCFKGICGSNWDFTKKFISSASS